MKNSEHRNVRFKGFWVVVKGDIMFALLPENIVGDASKQRNTLRKQ